MSYDICGWFDKQGNPLPDPQAAIEMRYDMEDGGRISDYARIGKDTVGDVLVSTVWLGMNHAFTPNGLAIFESLCFGGEQDGEMMRYSTEQEAIDGHRRAVENLRAGRPPWEDE